MGFVLKLTLLIPKKLTFKCGPVLIMERTQFVISVFLQVTWFGPILIQIFIKLTLMRSLKDFHLTVRLPMFFRCQVRGIPDFSVLKTVNAFLASAPTVFAKEQDKIKNA